MIGLNFDLRNASIARPSVSFLKFSFNQLSAFVRKVETISDGVGTFSAADEHFHQGSRLPELLTDSARRQQPVAQPDITS